MGNDKTIGIKFPFEISPDGNYVALTKNDKEEIKSNLAYFITSRKGKRLYKPNFGLDFDIHLFEQLDENTANLIKQQITSALSKYFKSLTINKVDIILSEEERLIGINVQYSYSDGIINYKDSTTVLFR